MKNRYSYLSLMVLSLGMFASAAQAQVHVPPGFLEDYDAAVAKAKAEAKPIYIHFTTDWCTWCRKIESETYPDASVRKALEGFVAVSLDCTDDESPKVAGWLTMMRRLGGQGFPTLAMVTPEGLPLNVVGGYVPPKVLTAELDKAAALWTKWRDFEKYAAKADKKSLDYNIKAMDIYSELSDYDKAASAAMVVLDHKDDKAAADKLPEAHLVILRSLLLAKPDERTAGNIDSHIDALRKLDPANKTGALSQALLLQSQSRLMRLSPQSPRQDVLKAADELAETLKGLDSLTREHKDQRVGLQILMANAGLLYAHVGQTDKAVAMLNDSLAVAPDSPAAEQIRSAIAGVKSREH